MGIESKLRKEGRGRTADRIFKVKNILRDLGGVVVMDTSFLVSMGFIKSGIGTSSQLVNKELLKDELSLTVRLEEVLRTSSQIQKSKALITKEVNTEYGERTDGFLKFWGYRQLDIFGPSNDDTDTRNYIERNIEAHNLLGDLIRGRRSLMRSLRFVSHIIPKSNGTYYSLIRGSVLRAKSDQYFENNKKNTGKYENRNNDPNILSKAILASLNHENVYSLITMDSDYADIVDSLIFNPEYVTNRGFVDLSKSSNLRIVQLDSESLNYKRVTAFNPDLRVMPGTLVA